MSLDLTHLQREIMLFIDDWVHTEKTPVPQTEILMKMSGSFSEAGTLYAIHSLLKNKYLRKSSLLSNKSKITVYIQLRRV